MSKNVEFEKRRLNEKEEQRKKEQKKNLEDHKNFLEKQEKVLKKKASTRVLKSAFGRKSRI